MKWSILPVFLGVLVISSLSCKKEKISSQQPNTNLKANQHIQAEVTTSRAAFDAHYVHVVYFWLKNPDSSNDRRLFEKSLRKFLNASAYAKTHFIGYPPKASREIVDDSFTYNLVLTFASASDQEAYQEEATHKLFIKESSHLWDRVQVYDAMTIND